MNDKRATELLDAEQQRLEQLLQRGNEAARRDRSAAIEPGDMTDSAEPLTSEEGDDAVLADLRDRLEKIELARTCLREGTYGRSVKSGLPISDERLEADPAAELTVEEAAQE